MGSTFLSHRGCDGSIVIDLSTSAKLYAPSFSINAAGIGNLVLDIDIIPSGIAEPHFSCRKCGVTIDDKLLELDIMAVCQICGHNTPVSNLSVHKHITSICSNCLDGVISCIEGNPSNHTIENYVENFGLANGKLVVVSMIRVLTSPIKL